MPNPNRKTTNNLPQMSVDLGYGLGFFCGCLVGAVGTYLAFTKEGQQLKSKIINEYRLHQQNLTLESLKSETNPVSSPTINSIRSAIVSLRHHLKKYTDHSISASNHPTASKSVKKKYFKHK